MEPPKKTVDSPIDALSTSFDDLLERLQTPAARQGLDAAFHASPAELGQAAVNAARMRNNSAAAKANPTGSATDVIISDP